MIRHKITNLAIHSQRIVQAKGLRILLGVVAIFQGGIRLDVVFGSTFANVSFGSNLLYAIALILGGIAVLITARNGKRLQISGRAAAIILAMIYATVGAAVFEVSTASAWTAFIYAAFLILEASAIYGDC